MSTLDILKETFHRQQNWLAITGAGISVASGIPTYRDDSGQWQRSDPIKHQDFLKSIEKRKRYWSRSFVGWSAVANAEPNRTHYALAKLESQGRLSGLITQNVDRLHQRAGHKHVIDLHGRLDRVRCLSCANYESRSSLQKRLLERNAFLHKLLNTDRIELAPDGDAFVEDDVAAKIELVSCTLCGGTLMPDVVFFGGTLEPSTRQASMRSFEACDGIIVLGSSLTVFSAYRFCKLAIQHKKPLVLINRGTTRADEIADLKINADCEEAIATLCQA